MKKILSLLMSAVIAASCALPAFAADSDKMKAALASVKTRIDLPAELTVFRSGVMNEKDADTGYTFRWSNEEETESIYVSADSEGRINGYSYSRNEDKGTGLADATKEQARLIAEAALKKAAPELFANPDDCLVYNESASRASAYNGYSWFSFTYERRHGGVKVDRNSASVSVRAYADTAYVNDMSISWNYETGFESAVASLADPDSKYIEQFPIELLYKRRYSAPTPIVLKNGVTLSGDVILQYSFKNGTGYISAVDGSILTPDAQKGIYALATGGGSNAMMKEEAADQAVFSEEELAELDRVENLISEEEAERILREIESLSITQGMTRDRTRIFRYRPWYLGDDKNEDNEKFRIRINLSGDGERTVYATLDAETGEIISISGWGGKDTQVSGDAKAIIARLIEQVCAEKAEECEPASETDNEYYIHGSMRRLVNGVPYEGNGISYGYDKKNARISSYNLEWDEYTEHFCDPSKAIGLPAAAEKMLEAVPLELIYIMNNGQFRLCYTLSKSSYYTDIDALTGKPLNRDTEQEQARIDYDDISGHWAETAIRRIAEVGICEAGKSFRPDSDMTQSELLRMYANAFLGGRYHDYDEDDFYDMLKRREYISEEEKNPESPVEREDAFVYMVRFMGYERVAKLSGIYSCNYADSAEISPQKLGYAAILTGFGVVSGDVNSIRARDNTTRAEAAMMVYKYLTYRD